MAEVLILVFILWIEKYGWNSIKNEESFLDSLLFSSSCFKFSIFWLSEGKLDKESEALVELEVIFTDSLFLLI